MSRRKRIKNPARVKERGGTITTQRRARLVCRHDTRNADFVHICNPVLRLAAIQRWRALRNLSDLAAKGGAA